VLGAEALTRPDLTGEWEYRLNLMEHKKLSREDLLLRNPGFIRTNEGR